jgi:VCBS repeat-containing protein
VLKNDTDSDNDSISAMQVSGPSNGTLHFNADGSFTYTPAADFNGQDQFTYRASDGSLDSNTVTVTILVNAANDPPSFTLGVDPAAVDEDAGAQVVIGFASNIRPGPASAIDEIGQSVAFALAVTATSGNLTFDVPPAIDPITGTLTYAAAPDTFGSATIAAALHDDGGIDNAGSDGSAPQIFTITINPVNDPPIVAVEPVYSVDEDATLNVPASLGLLAGADDADGNDLEAHLASPPNHGALHLNLDGSFVYTPDPNFHGMDSFTYRVHDGSTASGLVTVTVTVMSEVDPDINVLAFTSGGAGALDRLEITYEIRDGSSAPFDFSFFASSDATFDAGDIERGPRLPITAADRTPGVHTIRFDGKPYAAFLSDLAVSFFLAQADSAGAIGDEEPGNDGRNFIGIFQEPAVAPRSRVPRGKRPQPRPLVVRGHDDTDRYGDNPNDTIKIDGGKRKSLVLSSSFTPRPLTVSASELRILSLGGDDSVRAARKLSVPLRVLLGTGNDTAIGGSGADQLLGESGADLIRGGAGADILWAGDGDEQLVGNRGRDILFGDQGNDVLLGRRGRDALCGGTGSDILRGSRANDTGSGGAGPDSIFGGSGRNTLHSDALDLLLERGDVLADEGDLFCDALAHDLIK